ncbi:MAG TPA: FAD-binding oxidoreductase [Thermoanaerobaculia bacterium]|nr:FAD-binding oxidoreductase [Thermoanaerobaculia bacterium]
MTSTTIPAPRPAALADAILGVVPRVVYSPANVDECAEAMAQTASEKQRVAFIGGSTELGLGAAPGGLDAVVRSERMNRILEYAPADMVIVAEAGVALAQLQAVAAEQHQRLALDPPHPDRATIGGLVATGAYGPRRARYGAIRDLIIGVTIVRADGIVARGGGKVVKNVAGFDLPKVACGSLGTLGMIATATFRLHPLPEASATARFDAVPAEEVVALLASVRQSQLEPASAVAIHTSHGRYDLGVRFEGFAKGVQQQIDRIVALGAAAQTPCEPLGDGDAAAFWKRHDDVRGCGSLRVKVASLPSRFAGIDEFIAPILAALRGGSFAWYGTLGLGFASGDVEDIAAAIAALREAREALIRDGGSLVLEAAPNEVRAVIDPWGPAPGSFAIMEQLKLRFDPDRRLNRGRFVGGL